MRGKIISVSFRQAGCGGEWTCHDGEIGSAVNVRLSSLEKFSGEDASDEDGSAGDVLSASTGFSSVLPAPPKVEFGLARRIVRGWQNHLSNAPSKVVTAGIHSESGWGVKAMETLSRYADDAASQSLFISPFFVVYALRMSDGSRILPGPPVLMIPNSSAPEIGGTADWESAEMKMTVATAACALQFRVSGSSSVKTSDIGITHLDIMVSLPISTFDLKGEPVCRHRHVPTMFSHSLNQDGDCHEHPVYGDAFSVGWQAKPLTQGQIGMALTKTSSFRLISSVPLSSLMDSSDFSDVEINCGAIDSLELCEEYSPDYAHLQGIAADFSRMVSGRLTLCGLHLTLPAPFLPSEFSPRTDGIADNGRERASVEVETVKSGEVLRCSRCVADPDSEYFGNQPPRWVFFPDPDARKLMVATPSGNWSVTLRRHPVLYGSYYFGGLEDSVIGGFRIGGTVLPESDPVACNRDSYGLPSGVWRSEIGNRLLFPERLLARLEIGRVIAVCRAFRASGLIATTSPTLYLFTDEGVFLLKEMADGTLRDAGLIGNYVLQDSGSFRIGGGYVDFVEESGDLLRIEGTKIKKMKGEISSSSSGNQETGRLLIFPDNEEENVSVTTRALKLGNPVGRKRVGAVELIGTGCTDGFAVILSGSDNLRDWRELRRAGHGRITGIWKSGCRYFRVSVCGKLGAGEYLEGLVFHLR